MAKCFLLAPKSVMGGGKSRQTAKGMMWGEVDRVQKVWELRLCREELLRSWPKALFAIHSHLTYPHSHATRLLQPAPSLWPPSQGGASAHGGACAASPLTAMEILRLGAEITSGLAYLHGGRMGRGGEEGGGRV